MSQPIKCTARIFYTCQSPFQHSLHMLTDGTWENISGELPLRQLFKATIFIMAQHLVSKLNWSEVKCKNIWNICPKPLIITFFKHHHHHIGQAASTYTPTGEVCGSCQMIMSVTATGYVLAAERPPRQQSNWTQLTLIVGQQHTRAARFLTCANRSWTARIHEKHRSIFFFKTKNSWGQSSNKEESHSQYFITVNRDGDKGQTSRKTMT